MNATPFQIIKESNMDLSAKRMQDGSASVPNNPNDISALLRALEEIGMESVWNEGLEGPYQDESGRKIMITRGDTWIHISRYV